MGEGLKNEGWLNFVYTEGKNGALQIPEGECGWQLNSQIYPTQYGSQAIIPGNPVSIESISQIRNYKLPLT